MTSDQWTQWATISSAIGTVAYAGLTTFLVAVSMRQTRISANLQRISEEQVRIAALEAELLAQQLVTVTTKALAEAAQQLADLMLRVRPIDDSLRNGIPISSKAGIQEFLEDFLRFTTQQFPMLRAMLGAGHKELQWLISLQESARRAVKTTQWQIVAKEATQPDQFSKVLGGVFDLIVKEQERQSALLERARSVGVGDLT